MLLHFCRYYSGRSGASNKSDVAGGVLQTNNIHLATCSKGGVTKALAVLSPTTAKAKAKFILTTDGADFEAEDLTSGETVACAYQDFPDHFGFFLPLAGITTVKQIRESAFCRSEARAKPIRASPRSKMSRFRFGAEKFERCAAMSEIEASVKRVH